MPMCEETDSHRQLNTLLTEVSAVLESSSLEDDMGIPSRTRRAAMKTLGKDGAVHTATGRRDVGVDTTRVMTVSRTATK